jgi:hypothetical protein
MQCRVLAHASQVDQTWIVSQHNRQVAVAAERHCTSESAQTLESVLMPALPLCMCLFTTDPADVQAAILAAHF